MLSDAEATTGTDQTRYMNAKQAKDNYSWTLTAGTSFSWTTQATETWTLTIDLWKVFRTVEFAMCFSAYSAGWPVYSWVALYAHYECSTTASTLNYSRKFYNLRTDSWAWAMALSELITPLLSDTTKQTSLTRTQNDFIGTITWVYRDGTNLKIQYSLTSSNQAGYGQNITVGNVTIID